MDHATKIESLFQKYKRDVYNFLLYYMKTTDVDDVFQETFIHAHQALMKPIEISNARSWLITIARNTAIDYVRKEESRKRKLHRLKREQIRHRQTGLDEKMQLDERRTTILTAIYQMKKSYQDVVIVRGLKGFNVAESAEILNWNENQVRINYHRALKKLESILTEEGEFDEIQ